jgi:hypothetical protein
MTPRLANPQISGGEGWAFFAGTKAAGSQRSQELLDAMRLGTVATIEKPFDARIEKLMAVSLEEIGRGDGSQISGAWVLCDLHGN